MPEPILPWRVERFLIQAVKAGPRWVQRDAQQLLDTYEGLTNLEKAKQIVDESKELREVQNHLRAAFKNDELDGGWQTALEHPLYLQAAERLQELKQQLKELI